MEHEYMGPKLTQAEGMILGTAAKMFTIAGPVIVYGVSAPTHSQKIFSLFAVQTVMKYAPGVE